MTPGEILVSSRPNYGLRRRRDGSPGLVLGGLMAMPRRKPMPSEADLISPPSADWPGARRGVGGAARLPRPLVRHQPDYEVAVEEGATMIRLDGVCWTGPEGLTRGDHRQLSQGPRVPRPQRRRGRVRRDRRARARAGAGAAPQASPETSSSAPTESARTCARSARAAAARTRGHLRRGQPVGSGARATAVRPRRPPRRSVEVFLVVPKSFNDASRSRTSSRPRSGDPQPAERRDRPGQAPHRFLERADLRSGRRMQRVADKVFLLTPRNVEVSAGSGAPAREGLLHQY